MTDRIRTYEMTPTHLPGEEESYTCTVWEFNNVLVGNKNLKSVETVYGLNHNQSIQMGYLLNRLGVTFIDPKVYK